MENHKKTALFVGGNADGWTMEITETEPRLNWQDSFYLSKGTLDTKEFGTVQIYVFENMTTDEENHRLEIIKKAL